MEALRADYQRRRQPDDPGKEGYERGEDPAYDPVNFQGRSPERVAADHEAVGRFMGWAMLAVLVCSAVLIADYLVPGKKLLLTFLG